MREHAAEGTRHDLDRSFERLYRLHHREVLGVSLRELGNVHDAEDVTHAAFVDAYRAILRGSRPESPRAWLLAIAENVRRRRFRTARRRPREELVDADAVPAPEHPHEQARALRAAVAALPAPQRDVFLLREIRGLSYDDIAARLHASVPSVQMLLFRARRELRAELEPPAVGGRRSLCLSWPAWLLHLAGRGDRLAFTPRGAGALGAAVVVLGGSAAGVGELRDDVAPGRSVAQAQAPLPAGTNGAEPISAARAERSAPAGRVARATVRRSGGVAGASAAVPQGRTASADVEAVTGGTVGDAQASEPSPAPGVEPDGGSAADAVAPAVSSVTSTASPPVTAAPPGAPVELPKPAAPPVAPPSLPVEPPAPPGLPPTPPVAPPELPAPPPVSTPPVPPVVPPGPPLTPPGPPLTPPGPPVTPPGPPVTPPGPPLTPPGPPLTPPAPPLDPPPVPGLPP